MANALRWHKNVGGNCTWKLEVLGNQVPTWLPLPSYEVVIREVSSDVVGGIRSLVTLLLELPATDLTLGREDTIAPTIQEEMGGGGQEAVLTT